MESNEQLTPDVKTKEDMLKNLDVLLDEDLPYHQRLEAYEYLMEDCEPILEDMIDKIYTTEGETGKMLMEILAEYKGNKAIFMGLVSYLYKGEDVALFARLIGAYGDEQGVEVLKTFCENYEPNYNEYMELRNAVEELGGDFDLKQDFSDDPFYRFLKGLDEVDDESRKSPLRTISSKIANVPTKRATRISTARTKIAIVTMTIASAIIMIVRTRIATAIIMIVKTSIATAVIITTIDLIFHNVLHAFGRAFLFAFSVFTASKTSRNTTIANSITPSTLLTG